MELQTSDVGAFKLITVAGKIDWESARRLDAEVQAVIQGGANHLVFDLDRVTFLCSGAIGALTYNLNKVKSKQGSFYIISSNDYVNYIFETLRFDVVFNGLLFKTFSDFRAAVLDKQGETPPS